MNYLKLTADKLDVNFINDLVAHESCGAISFFVGTTRDNFEDKKVVTLEYEAYEPMALKQMTKICDNLRAKWPDIKHIAIYHRLGIVPVKEASVVIGISSPHRQTSLCSVQEAIDELKTSVPIWKKEKYDNADAAWKVNKESIPNQNNKARVFKRSKLNFDACSIDVTPVPKNLVQIAADETEVSRRIHCFVEKKREEIDLTNISSFIEKKSDPSGEESSCARINSMVFKQKDFKGHLRVHRVKNIFGPQDKPDYTSTLDKLMTQDPILSRIKQEPREQASSLPPGLEERLENIEKFLGTSLVPGPKDAYARIKSIEDRILFLESISPEYHHFLSEKPTVGSRKCKKRTYSIQDIDRYIEEIEKPLLQKSVKT